MSRLSLYEQAMGSGFDKLAESVQTFHRLSGRHELRGSVQTHAPTSWLAKLLGRSLGTPGEHSRGAIRFELDAQPDFEFWIRHFPTRTMASCLSLDEQGLIEKLGAARLTFRLEEFNGSLLIRLTRLHFLGVPCPQWAMPLVVAEETGDAGRLHFKVLASLPLIGTVASYAGYLEIGPEVR